MNLEMLERRSLLSGITMLALVGDGAAGAALGQAAAPPQPTSPQPAQTAATVSPTTSPLEGIAPITIKTAVATTLQIHAWSKPLETTSIDGMVWAWVRNDPLAEARRVAPALQALPQGKRVLIIGDALTSGFASYDRNNPGAFIAKGWDVSKDQQWSGTFFLALRNLGVPLDRVVADNESEFTTWTLFDGRTEQQQVQVMQGIYGNPAAYAKLPTEVRAFTPQDFLSQHTNRGHDAFDAWNKWERQVFASAFQSGITTPLQALYGASVTVGNYGDLSPRVEVLDKNGWLWAQPNAVVGGNMNSPELYLWTGIKYGSMQKDWRWNRLIDVLNIARAAQEVPNKPITPWISFPRFQGDHVPQARSTWLWEQMMRHLVAGGISSFIYWNPADQTDARQEQFADALFKSLAPGTPTQQSLTPIPFDADTITTNGVTTTYQDFLRCVDDPNATGVSVTPTRTPPQSLPAAPSPRQPVGSTPVRQPFNKNLIDTLPSTPPQAPAGVPSPIGSDMPSSPTGAEDLSSTMTATTTATMTVPAPQSALSATSATSSSILTNRRMGLTSLYEWLDTSAVE